MRERQHPEELEQPGRVSQEQEKRGVSRRELLRGAGATALAAAGACIAGVGLGAQKTGIMPGGGKVPFKLPLGALDDLDRQQYLHNMEIISHTPGVRISSGEPLIVLWARSKQRLLPAGAGFLDISDPRKPVLMSTGETRIQGNVAYNRNLKKWIMMSTASRPLSAATPDFPYGHYHKELREKTLNYKGLRGIRTFDVTHPAKPVLLNEFSTGERGGGTHHNFYDGGKYAYLEAGWDDDLRMENAQRPSSHAVMIVDMSDPANVKEVSRWWVPGQKLGEEEEYKKYWFAGDESSWTGNHGSVTVPKRVEDGGTIGYAGFGHFGLITLDLSDITRPKMLSQYQAPFESMGGIPYHTVYPIIADAKHPRLRNIVIGSPETVQPDCREPYKPVQILDMSDPRNPRLVGLLPRPKPPKEAPYADFCQARGRFGWHNTQAWAAPGDFRPELLAITAFNAGLRFFDLSDPTQPKEVAWFVPPRDGDIEKYETWFRGTAENVFVEWDRNLIWLATHEGTYCLTSPALGKPVLEPRKIERWTVPHINAGWDDQTAASIFLGRGTSQMGL